MRGKDDSLLRRSVGRRMIVQLLVCGMATALLTQTAVGQSGLREALERMDRNENGLIEPKFRLDEGSLCVRKHHKHNARG